MIVTILKKPLGDAISLCDADICLVTTDEVQHFGAAHYIPFDASCYDDFLANGADFGPLSYFICNLHAESIWALIQDWIQTKRQLNLYRGAINLTYASIKTFN